MKKTAIKLALLGMIGLLAAASPAAQDRTGEPAHATGLIPLTAAELADIVASWPRVIRVNLNPLGLERINAVRAAKGLAALDASEARPIGAEVEGTVAGRGAAVLASPEASFMAGDLPVSVDNSLLRFFPPIRDQGSLGSCASFSTAYYQLSHMTALQRNLDIRNDADNTNKYSPKWTYNMTNDGEDNGSSFYQNYMIMERHGAATWAELPYDWDYRAWSLNGTVWRNALGARTRITQYVSDASTDAGLAQLKALLADGYVLVFGTYINSWVFASARDDTSTADDDAARGKHVAYCQIGYDGSHAMTIVGYNDAVWTDINSNGAIDAGEKGAFRIANSWGTGWQESGFTWLAYDALRDISALPGDPVAARMGAFQDDVVYVLTARNGYTPLMVGEFTVTHAKRDQLHAFLGRSSTSTTTPTTTWMPAVLQNQGGAYAFDGTTTAVAGTFVLDFTDILTAGTGLERYYLEVSDSGGPDAATLSAFKIVDSTTEPNTETVCSLVPQTVASGMILAYVDYSYAGPAYDNPPQLSLPQLNWGIGRPTDTFTYQVRYYDADGDAPSTANVVVDGTAHAMTLLSGQAADGWYTLGLTLAAGNHDYYFYFEDGHGESARAPLAGAAAGPAVYDLLLNAISPPSAALGGAAFTLAAYGTDFTSGAVVTWDGADRTTAYVSPTRLDAAIPASDLALGKVVAVAVRNAPGSVSNVQTFTVNNLAPIMGWTIPASATGGGPALTVTLHGWYFAPNATARWDGADRPTTYVSPTEIQAALTVADLSVPRDHGFTVRNPAPAGGMTASQTFSVSGFSIAAPSPTANIAAGLSAAFSIEVTPRYASFDSAISFSCSGLPRGTTATFSPATVTPGISLETTTLTLTTRAKTGGAGAAATAGSGAAGPPVLPLALLGAALMALALAARLPSRQPVRRALPAALILLLLLLNLAGCGAGGGGSQDQGTPAGTYEITVSATSSNLTATTTITLTVL